MILKPDHCRSCVGWSWGCGGYVPADGTGDNGCLVVLEAAGADEELSGIPTVGQAGQYLWNQLHRVGVEREGFRIHNVLSCRPPANKLSKMPYEAAAINHCAPLLDATITDHVTHCKQVGKTPVIIALGKIAFKRLMGVTDRDEVMKESNLAYPFWSHKYNSWIISTHHPSHLMQGKQHLTPLLTYVFERALEIAADGLQLDSLNYIEDPDAWSFQMWVDDYKRAIQADSSLILSYDIETPYKQGKDEADITRSEDGDGAILRCSFSYRPGHSVSVPWRSSYYPALADIFASNGSKVGWNNSQFDAPKIKEYFPINGDDIDAMLAWHVLNSSFPKGLGFVTPFYAQRFPMWKHLSREKPAFYNAADADAALRCWLGIKADLQRNNLWEVFNRHVTEVHRVFKYMSDKGVLLDQQMRRDAELQLAGMLAGIEDAMEAAIPLAAKRLKVFKKAPKDTTGMLQVDGLAKVAVCPNCGMIGVKADHFKSIGKKRLAKGEIDNSCHGFKAQKQEIKQQLWAVPLEWKASKLGLTNYQAAAKHAPVFDRKKGKTTYDESAMMRLMKKYPGDTLYPLILDHREKQKLLGTYIGITQPNGIIKGGMPIGVDGYVHTQFTSNPSTLRSASQNPNLQNLPRPTDDLSKIIRNLIMASPGNILYARDFSGIEAVLVGYDAAAPGYMRLARRDVHTYYTAWALNELEPGRIPTNDLPLLSWDDEKLFTHLAGLKGQLKKERNNLYKHLVHAANFMQSAKGAREKIYAETGQEFDISRVQRVMDIYFELFPEIRKWHYAVLLQAEKDGYLRNAFGYLHRFSHVFNYEKVGTKWEKRPNPDVANKVVAFGPQSNAAGIIKEAMLVLFQNHFEEAGQYLRLLVHDELLSDVPEGQLDNVDRLSQTVMEAPIPQFRLPENYNLGPYLSILTEAKQGFRWALMK